MDDVKKMFRTIVNGQTALKLELLGEFGKTNNEVRLLKKEMREGFKQVNRRLDKQGKSLVYLEDDAPTTEEFNKLGLAP
jgi:hypothetical protein